MNTTLLTLLQLPLLAGGEDTAESLAAIPPPPAEEPPPIESAVPDFPRVLDEAIAQLTAPGDAALAFPSDEIHRDILLPLLPAMLGDAAIREHWSAAGIAARAWAAGDFEIPVTASYHAGPDARALADTLLAEPSFRELCAALLNQIRAAAPAPVVEEARALLPMETSEPPPAALPADPLDALLARLCEPRGVSLAELLAEPELLARLASAEGGRCRVIVLPA